MTDKLKLNMKMVEKGFSQRSFAVEMKKSKNTISAIFTGKKQPRLDEVDDMCRILEIEDPLEKIQIFLN